MIDINNFLELKHNAVKYIISEFNIQGEFSSHDFIEKFTENFESEYIEMLVKYQSTGTAFQQVHQQIARWLSLNKSSLQIEKTERKESENVRGKQNYIQWWIRIK